MKGLIDNGGVWQDEDDKIKEIVASYYHGLFSSIDPTPEMKQEVLKHMRCFISPKVNAELMKQYKKDEIFAALRQMHPCKAPGPDDMHAIFFSKNLAYYG